MPAAPLPLNEPQRLEALARYEILDTLPESEYDDLTALAAAICQAPISLVSFVDDDRQWFKSHHGLEALQTPREQSFCAHTLESDVVFEVPDTRQNPLFQNNELVTGAPKIRFYAGAPLITSDNFHLGTLCVIDHQPRQLTDEQKRALEALARQVVTQLELRRSLAGQKQANARLQNEIEARMTAQSQLRSSEASFRHLAESSPDLICAYDEGECLTYVSASARVLLGVEPAQLVGLGAHGLFHPDDFSPDVSLRQWMGTLETARLVRAKKRDGSWMWLEVRGHAILHPETGDVLGFHSTARDMSERVQSDARRQSLLDGLGAIVRAADTLIEARTEDELLRLCVRRAHLDLGFGAAKVFLLGDAQDELEGAYALDRSCPEGVRALNGECCSLAMALGVPNRKPSAMSGEDGAAQSDAGWMFPLNAGEQLLGALWLGERGEADDGDAVNAELGAVLASLLSTLLQRARAENRAGQSQKLLSTVVENAPIILYAADTSERITLSVGRGLADIGFDENTMRGRTVSDIAGEGSLTTTGVRAALRGESNDAVASFNGQEFDAFRRPIRDEKGEISGVVGVLVNVTDRARVQKALEASEARYRSVVDSLSEIIFQSDAEGHWLFLNQAWEDVLGYSVEESLGRRASEFMHPDDLASVAVGKRALIERPDAPHEPMLVRYLTCDGQRRWMEAYSRATFDASTGAYTGMMGTLNDITERFEAERALRETTQMQRAILSSASYAIWSCDAQGIIRSFNKAAEEMLLLPASATCGLVRAPLLIDAPNLQERADELGRELDREVSAWEALTLPALASGREEREWTGIRADGEHFPMRLSLSPLSDESGQVEGFVAIGYDLTDAKRAEKLKSEFISIVSHELRTPLTSIRGALGLVEAGVAGELPPKAAQMVSIAHKNSERLVLLINDILDIEKMEGGQMRFEKASLDFGSLLHNALQTNAPYAQNLGVELECDGPDTPIEIEGDEARLGQVLTNLLSNAAKFSPRGGRVRVQTRVLPATQSKARRVRVDVFDDGPGVPPEFEPRLFERFAQADSSATRVSGGSGLGLSISRAIVEQHGGTLSYHAVTSGQQHSFSFELPVSDVSSVAPATQQKILVCEDDPEIARLLGLMLEEQGFVVETAPTLEEARTKIREGGFAALTLDLMLPDGDGIEFLGELREGGIEIPVVVVSAYAEEGRVRGSALDVLDWLHKPLDPARLLRAVASLGRDIHHRARVLHVEDDADVREVTRAILGDGLDIVPAATLEEARALLAGPRFDLALLDIGLPDGDGLELVPLLASQSPPVPVALFSAQEPDGPRARAVGAALVKSRATGADLRATIERLLHPAPVA